MLELFYLKKTTPYKKDCNNSVEHFMSITVNDPSCLGVLEAELFFLCKKEHYHVVILLKNKLDSPSNTNSTALSLVGKRPTIATKQTDN